MTTALRRRDFIAAVGSAATVAAALSFAARAQQTDRKRRIGVLIGLPASDAVGQTEITAFREALQKLGWSAGRNIEIEYRWAGTDADRVQAFANELLALHPDVILARGTPALSVLKRETSAVPIVFAVVTEPLVSGLITSLARPGGNITGFSNVEPSIAGKWLELLKEMAPSVTRVGILFNPTTAPYAEPFLRSAEAAAAALAMESVAMPVRSDAEIEAAVATLAREPASGLVGMTDSFINERRKTIIELADRHRLPAIYSFHLYATDGGLMSYGAEVDDMFQRAATYVDRILRGEKAGDLPVQQPTKFELVINLKTAKALGLTVPPTMLTRADEVIE
jgi:putative ABC transport system substrate-binding protein